ncbi:protein RKD4-like [Neltuma alba]|uniref:protein RKD4-like n=1 Tax=Neltuma alba TaxID=207710 RepID=UPI0010A36B14|nr:protein RKD4-like [Prosopis alba]
MDCYFSDFDLPNLDYPHGFTSYNPTYPQETILEMSPVMGLADMDLMVPPPYESNPIYLNQFPELENFGSNFSGFDYSIPSFYDDLVIDEKPCTIVLPNHSQSRSFPIQRGQSSSSMFIGSGFAPSIKTEEDETRNRISYNRKKRSANLELDDIRKYFHVPITKAAKELNVGLTLLKRRCRELNITRWPHRKIKSLKTLIDNVKELGLANEVAMLEKHKKLMEKLPDIELSERTKKLRQACFKANYKRRRSLGLQAQA